MFPRENRVVVQWFPLNHDFLSEGRVFPRENGVAVRWFPLKHDFLSEGRVFPRENGVVVRWFPRRTNLGPISLLRDWSTDRN